MTTYYLDFAGGGDNSHDGKSFANRVKDWTKLADIVAGDEVRVMASPEPTNVADANWTNGGDTVVLPAAVTAAVGDLSTAMTASTNVTASAVSTSGELVLGYKAQLDISGAFGTGKLAYLPLGSALDLSAYQQISLWFMSSGGADNLDMELRLCTDTAGNTAVHTISLPNATLPNGASAANEWLTVVKDFGTNLNASIQSIAIYANVVPGALTLSFNNIIACKASSAADSLTHESLLAKVNALPWAPSTVYSAGDVRKPLAGSRNGWGYRCIAGGTSGTVEPVWPDTRGDTVADGSASWECADLEEPWFAIANIDDATVTLEEQGYPGVTESIATYKRQPIPVPATLQVGTKGDGTPDNWITLSGGWDTGSMSSKVGETWLTARGMPVWMLRRSNYNAQVDDTPSNMQGLEYWDVSNIHWRRFGRGINPWSAILKLHDMSVGSTHVALDEATWGASTGIDLRAVKFMDCMHPMHNVGGDVTGDKCDFICGRMPNAAGYPDYGQNIDCYAGNPTEPNIRGGFYTVNLTRCRFRSCSAIYRGGDEHMLADCDFDPNGYTNFAFTNKGTVLRGANAYVDGYPTGGAWGRGRARLQDCSGAPAPVVISIEDTWMIQADDTVRHSGTGISWKYVTSDPWGSIYARSPASPVVLTVGKLYVQAGTPVNVSIWARRDAVGVNARLVVRGSQLPGVPEQVQSINPSTLDTWESVGSITLAPTVSGVIEVEVWFDNIVDPDYIVRNFWVDDLTVT